MQTGIEKARMSSFELLSHLEEESLGNKNSEEHYETLIQNISGVNNSLIEINSTLSLDSLDKELNSIEEEIVPLTKQSPYTLFMMRAVEIGLPLLLSIISIFFTLRYSLSEERCYEIKDAIKLRNEARING